MPLHTPVGDMGSESEVVLCQAFQSERLSVGVLETEANALVGEVGQSRKAGVVPRWPLVGQTFWSMIGLPFWPIIHILGPAHELRVCLLGPSLC